MPQFLFVVDIPPPGLSTEDPDAASRWFAFETRAKSVSLPAGGSKLPCRNAWLLPVEGSDPPLLELSNAAQDFLLSHSTYLISGEVTPLTKPGMFVKS